MDPLNTDASSILSHELDFVGFAGAVNVNNNANGARVESQRRKRARQLHLAVLLEHFTHSHSLTP